MTKSGDKTLKPSCRGDEYRYPTGWKWPTPPHRSGGTIT